VKRISSIFIILFFLLFNPKKIFAVQITLLDVPQAISQNEFTLTASVSGTLTGINYLRIDIFKEGTSNYFGETFTGSVWYGGSEGTQYYPITLQSGIPWNGQIKGRVGSPNSTEYDGLGSYKLRVRRYTSSGNYNSDEANANALFITIAFPTITPLPSATNVPTKTPTPIDTPKPTVLPSEIPTKKLTPTNEKHEEDDEDNAIVENASQAAVLGEKIVNIQKLRPTPSVKVLSESYINNSFIFMSAGAALLIACGILVFYIQRKIVR
jgi:hypothetical protein